jgi:hypothetical protein
LPIRGLLFGFHLLKVLTVVHLCVFWLHTLHILVIYFHLLIEKKNLACLPLYNVTKTLLHYAKPLCSFVEVTGFDCFIR